MMKKISLIKRKINTFFHTERILTKKLQGTCLYNLMPDKMALDLCFYNIFGRRVNWKNPTTFTEKLQWLKLYNRNPLYTTLVDKYAVKDWVANKIGEEYVIPTYGVWDSFDEIDFDTLPNQFVLKTTHGGGSSGVVICRHKSSFDFAGAKARLTASLKSNTYLISREWPYKDVPRRIIAEQYIEDSTGGLVDYKVMCFNGEPKLIQVHLGRYSLNHTQDFYNIDWKKTEIAQKSSDTSDTNIEKPACFDDMVSLSKSLATGIPHVRVDWYIVDNQLYLGELTFFDASGYDEFTPDKYNYIIGDWIKLPERRI